MEGDIYDRIQADKAIVCVAAKNGEQVMAATGFFYGKHDFLITAGHVAAFASPADNITIRFQHSEEEFACTTAFVSDSDFAVLRVTKPITHSFLYCNGSHFLISVTQ